MGATLRAVAAVMLAGAVVWSCGAPAFAEAPALPRECVQVADAIACAPPGSSGPPEILCWTPDEESRHVPPFDGLPDGVEICGLILVDKPNA